MTNDPLGPDNEQFPNHRLEKPLIIKKRPNWVEGKILDDWLFNDSDYLPGDLRE